MIKHVLLLVVILALTGCAKKPAQLGKDFVDLGDYENAITVFEQQVLLHPKDADLRFEMGKAYAQLDQGRKALQQYGFAANIGSAAFCDSFLTWGKKMTREYPASNQAYYFFDLAVTANPKNADALFEKARYEVRYADQNWPDKQKSLADLAVALRKNADDYAAKGAFEALQNNRELLFHAYAEKLNSGEYGECGSAALSPDGKTMVWVAEKRHARRYSSWVLCSKVLGDTTIQELRELESSAAFPCFFPDSVTILFCDKGQVFRRDLRSNADVFFCNGAFPTVSADGKTVVFAKNGGLYKINIDGTESTALLADRTFRCAPKFGADGRIYFLSEAGDKVIVAACDTGGQNVKTTLQTAIPSWYIRNQPGQYCFDIDPSSDMVVINNGEQLAFYSLHDSSMSGTNLRGRFPRFSADGQKIVAVLDTAEGREQLWLIDKTAYFSLDNLLAAAEPHKKEMIKLLEKVAKG